MSFDGSGVYSLTYTWATEAASPPIDIAKLDTEFAGIAAGLSLAILRNGNGKPTANIDWNAQKITNLGNATADADALNRVTADGRYARVGSNETVTGAWTFTTNPTVTNVEPALWLNETDAGSNEKVWRWVAASGSLYLQTMTDALAPGTSLLAFTRSGTAAGSMTFNGNTVWHAGNDGSGSGLDADTVDGVQASALAQMSSGSFTATLASASSGGTVYVTGTAYWSKIGNLVTLTLPATFKAAALSGNNYAFVRDLPAAIRSACAIQQTVSVPIEDENTYLTGLLEIFTGSVDYMRLYTAGGTYGFAGTVPGFYAGATFTYRVSD